MVSYTHLRLRSKTKLQLDNAQEGSKELLVASTRVLVDTRPYRNPGEIFDGGVPIQLVVAGFRSNSIWRRCAFTRSSLASGAAEMNEVTVRTSYFIRDGL
jgi:hypothetical protein